MTILISCGEPAGIGPEVAAKAWAALKEDLALAWIGDPRASACRHSGGRDRRPGGGGLGLPLSHAGAGARFRRRGPAWRRQSRPCRPCGRGDLGRGGAGDGGPGAGDLHRAHPQAGAGRWRGLCLSRPYRVSGRAGRRAARGDDAGGRWPQGGAGDHPHRAGRGAGRADRRGHRRDHPPDRMPACGATSASPRRASPWPGSTPMRARAARWAARRSR